MSEPIILPPDFTINSVATDPLDIDCNTSYFWEELLEAFTMPASGATSSITVCNTAHYVTGCYLWLRTAGWLEITSKPSQTSLTVRNNGYENNAAPTSVIVAGTPFVHTPPATPTGIDESDTINVPSIADGDQYNTDITVTGAALGDFVMLGFSASIGAIAVTAAVTAADTVTVNWVNNTGGAVDLASMDVYVRVIPK